MTTTRLSQTQQEANIKQDDTAGLEGHRLFLDANTCGTNID